MIEITDLRKIYHMGNVEVKALDGVRQRLIQDAFPQLSPAEREFLITGMTKEEWGEAFSEEIPEEDEE